MQDFIATEKQKAQNNTAKNKSPNKQVRTVKSKQRVGSALDCLKREISPPQVTYTQLMQQKQHLIKNSSKVTLNSATLNLQSQISSQRTEILPQNFSAQANQHQLNSKHLHSKSKLIQKYSRTKRVDNSEESNQNKKSQRLLYSNSKSRERSQPSQDKLRAITHQFGGVNLVLPIDQQSSQYNDKLLIDPLDSREIANLKEISDSLGSKINSIQNQIGNIGGSPLKYKNKILSEESKIQSPFKDFSEKYYKCLKQNSYQNQKNYNVLKMIQEKDDMISELQSQLSSQIKEFKNQEKNFQMKFNQERDMLVQKLSAPPKDPVPQNDLIRQLTKQLKDSTKVIKTQQIQINNLKQQSQLQLPQQTTFSAQFQQDQQDLIVKKQIFQIEKEKDNLQNKLDIRDQDYLEKSILLQDQNQQLLKLQTKNSQQTLEFQNITTALKLELSQKSSELKDAQDNFHQITQQYQILENKMEKQKFNLESQLKLATDQIANLILSERYKFEEIEEQVIEETKSQQILRDQNCENHQIVSDLQVSNQIQQEQFQIENKKSNNQHLNVDQIIQTEDQFDNDQTTEINLWKDSIKLEYDTKIAEEVAKHTIEFSNLSAILNSQIKELKLHFEAEKDKLIEEHQSQQKQSLRELEEEYEEQEMANIQKIKKLEGEIKQLNIMKTKEDSTQLLQQIKFQNEINSLHQTIDDQKKQQQEYLHQCEQMVSSYEQELEQLKQNQSEETIKTLSDKDLQIVGLQNQIDALRSEIEISKAQSVSAQELQIKNEQITEQIQNIEDESNNKFNDKQIQELLQQIASLNEKLNISQQQIGNLENKEAYLQKCVEEKELNLQKITEQIKISTCSEEFAQKQLDQLQLELERVKKQNAQANQISQVDLDLNSKIDQLNSEFVAALDRSYKIKQEKSQIQNDFSQLQIQHEQTLQIIEDNDHKYATQIQNYMNQVQELNSVNQQLRQELKDEQEQSEKTIQLLKQDLINEKQNSSHNIAKITEEIQAYELKIKKLEADQTENLETIEEYQEDVNSRESLLKETEQRLNQEIANLKVNLKQSQQIEEDQSQQIVQLQQDLNEKSESIEELQQLNENSVNILEHKQICETLTSQISFFTTNQKTLISSIESHKSDINSLKQKLTKSQTDLNDKILEHQELERKYENLSENLGQLQEKHQQELEEKKQKYQQLQIQEQILQKELQEKELSHEDQIKLITEQYNSTIRSTKEELLLQIQALESQLKITSEENNKIIAKLKSQISELKQQLEQSTQGADQQVQDMIEKVNRLTEEVLEREQQIEQLQEELRELRESEHLLKRDLEQESLAKRNVEIKLTDQIKLTSETVKENEIMQQSINQLNDLIQLADQKTRETEDQLHDYEEQIQGFKEQEGELLNQISEFEDQVKLLEQEKSDQEIQHKKELDEMSEMALQEIQSYEEKIENHQQSISLTESENQRLSKEYNSVERQVKTLKQQIAQINKLPTQQQFDQVLNENMILKEKLDQSPTQDQLNAQVNENKQLKQNIADQKLEIQKINLILNEQKENTQKQILAQQQSMEKVIESLQNNLTDKENELSQKNKQYLTAQQMCESLKIQIETDQQKSQKELKNLQVQVSMGQQVMQQLQQEMDLIEKEKVKLKQEVLNSRNTVEKLTMQLAKAMEGGKK